MFKCPFALPDTAAKRRTSDEEIVSRPGYFPAVSDSLPPSLLRCPFAPPPSLFFAQNCCTLACGSFHC